MESRKSVWPLMYFAAGLETATFLSWMSEKSSLITGLLAVTIAVDMYAYSKMYRKYKESKDYVDFIIQDNDPIFSHLYKRNEKELRQGIKILQGFFKCSAQSLPSKEVTDHISHSMGF
jgi:hypothetical protein